MKLTRTSLMKCQPCSCHPIVYKLISGHLLLSMIACGNTKKVMDKKARNAKLEYNNVQKWNKLGAIELSISICY